MIRFMLFLLTIMLAAACGSEAPGDPAAASTDRAGYVVLDDDLTALIDDFNAHAGKVRQIYVVGPTCGICLRGMADLDAALVAGAQDDPRLQTLVVHVPALGAEERHVEPSIHLLQGPRVSHYWDGSGHSGLELQAALGLPIYAWDVWLVYGPQARWEPGNEPPAPEFWQHQLGALGVEYGSLLEPDVFAAEVRFRMASIDPAALPGSARIAAAAVPVEGDVIRVEQPRGFVIQQHLTTRGGYHELKRIRARTATGTLAAGGAEYPVTVVADDADRYQRTVEGPDGIVVTVVEGGAIQHQGQALVPRAVDDAVLAAFEFDGWLMEWKDKGHQVWRLGMVRDEDRLPWLMEVEHRNGQTWRLYLDSHTGDDYRSVLLDSQGRPSIVLERDDFRPVAGFRVPHAVRLSDSRGTVAEYRFSRVTVELDAEPLQLSEDH